MPFSAESRNARAAMTLKDEAACPVENTTVRFDAFPANTANSNALLGDAVVCDRIGMHEPPVIVHERCGAVRDRCKTVIDRLPSCGRIYPQHEGTQAQDRNRDHQSCADRQTTLQGNESPARTDRRGHYGRATYPAPRTVERAGDLRTSDVGGVFARQSRSNLGPRTRPNTARGA